MSVRKMAVLTLVLILIMMGVAAIGSLLLSKDSIELSLRLWVVCMVPFPIIGIFILIVILTSIGIWCLKLKEKF